MFPSAKEISAGSVVAVGCLEVVVFLGPVNVHRAATFAGREQTQLDDVFGHARVGPGKAGPRIAEGVDQHLVVPQQAAIALALNALQTQARIATHVDAGLAARVVASLVIDRALASGEPVTDEELHKIVVQWLVPVLPPQMVDGRTLRPTAEPG